MGQRVLRFAQIVGDLGWDRWCLTLVWVTGFGVAAVAMPVWVFAGLHIVDAVLDGDLGEGDAGGGGLAGGEHAGEVQRGVAVFEVELVHGGGEFVAVGGIAEERGLELGSRG